MDSIKRSYQYGTLGDMSASFGPRPCYEDNAERKTEASKRPRLERECAASPDKSLNHLLIHQYSNQEVSGSPGSCPQLGIPEYSSIDNGMNLLADETNAQKHGSSLKKDLPIWNNLFLQNHQPWSEWDNVLSTDYDGLISLESLPSISEASLPSAFSTNSSNNIADFYFGDIVNEAVGINDACDRSWLIDNSGDVLSDLDWNGFAATGLHHIAAPDDCEYIDDKFSEKRGFTDLNKQISHSSNRTFLNMLKIIVSCYQNLRRIYPKALQYLWICKKKLSTQIFYPMFNFPRHPTLSPVWLASI
jgi:hypothetical protein